MHPAAVFSFLRVLGGTVERVLIVGCEPARTAEEIGLSEPVARAVPEAVTLILDLIQREGPSGPAPTQSRQGRD